MKLSEREKGRMEGAVYVMFIWMGMLLLNYWLPKVVIWWINFTPPK